MTPSLPTSLVPGVNRSLREELVWCVAARGLWDRTGLGLNADLTSWGPEQIAQLLEVRICPSLRTAPGAAWLRVPGST